MSNKKEDFRYKKFNNQKPVKGKAKPKHMERYTSQPPQQKEKKSFSFGPTAQKLLPWIYFLLFALVAFIYLAVLNKEYLYGCQEHSIWQNNQEYFDDRMRAVGGFCQWLGCYLTQYFFYPWAGSLILIALWGLIYLLTLKVFHISNRWSVVALAPVVLLLCSEIYLGYWMYYTKMPGYWFTYTVAILIMLIGMYICRLYKGYAIREAGKVLGTFDLSGCELYTTGEPCHMCLCACMWANIDKIYFGCTIEDNGIIGFRDDKFDAIFGGRDKLPGFMTKLDRMACLELFQEYAAGNHQNY